VSKRNSRTKVRLLFRQGKKPKAAAGPRL